MLRQYFADTARDHALTERIRFHTEVERAEFDEATGLWTLSTRQDNGEKGSVTANAVISAVGQLNRPKWPDIPGQDRYQGIHFHSTEWKHEHDLTGKKVIVIGTGASAFQFAPEIAKVAGSVTIFQRTPPWISPNEDYHADIPDGKHWLLNHVPFYAKWFRFNMFWRTAEGILQAVEKDPSWNDQDRSISALNDELRQMLTESIREQCGDDKELFKTILPTYPPGGKRMLIDNGSYIAALKRDNVQITNDPIREINESGVLSESGEQHDADVLIYGTGFYASRFLWPMEVRGQGGVSLDDHWRGEPRAYMGITVPKFPNLFCMYGPNTNIVVNGSIIFFSECEIRYIVNCVRVLLERGAAAMAPKPSVHDEYNRWIDEGNLDMAWGAANVPTWYKNEAGRVTQNWPFTLLKYWDQTRAVNPADYDFVPGS